MRAAYANVYNVFDGFASFSTPGLRVNFSNKIPDFLLIFIYFRGNVRAIRP